MKKSIKTLVLYYLREVAANEYSDEDIIYMSENFVKDLDRLKSARDDFKEAE